jgi:outer membrane biosynthesis protein TonB
VAVTETLDTLETIFREIAEADLPPVHDERSEPTLASAPLFVEFGEPARLDPDRIGLIWELPSPSGRSIRLRSPLVSLAVHLLLLLAIIAWPSPAADIAPPIAVQLVFVEPPPPPPPEPKLAQPPPPPAQPQQGRLSSVDTGDVKPKERGSTTSAAPPAAGEPQPNPTETQTATAAPTPPLLPLPKPAPPKEKSAFQLAKPAGAQVPRREETPHQASRSAQFAGPSATRDEYLAYLVQLTRQHIDLLPMSVIGDRHGETVISVVVYDSGEIGPLGVVRSSGYSDIDHRIEQMVAAVRKFPPLPQWYQGKAVQLELTLRFPDALER